VRGGANNESRGYWPTAAGSSIGVRVAELVDVVERHHHETVRDQVQVAQPG
jgi:hypothetical protein